VAYLGPSLRRTPRRSRPWLRATVALALSLVANALVLALVRVGKLVGPGDARSAPQMVSLNTLSRSEWEANRSVGRAAPGKSVPPPPEVAPAAPRKAPGQVVDVAPSKDSTPPKDSRFVSDRNNTVEKETRSRNARAGYQNTLPKPSSPKAAPPPRSAEAERSASRRAAGGGGRRGGGVAAPGSPGQPARGRLALKLDERGDLRLREPKPEVRERLGSSRAGGAGEGTPGPGSAALGRIQLYPSASVYDQLAGGPAPDHLEGVEEGEGTYLNTREWKYATYFNRIKQAVATQWDPVTPLRQRDPTLQRFAYKDRITVLSVKLDGSGALRGLNVAKSSGVDFLDRSAVEAFQRAQPFVNPPRGLADGNGEIAFTFGFVVEGGGFRIFRGPARY
jgi:TonB family protein